MSLFTEQEVTARYYAYTDSLVTKITSINFGTASYTSFLINIIRIGDADALIEGDVLGEYRANVTFSGAHRGGLVWISATEIYQIVKEPRYNKLFRKYKLNLKRLV